MKFLVDAQLPIRLARFLQASRVVDLLSTYPDRKELFQEFPELEEENIQQALIFASSYQ